MQNLMEYSAREYHERQIKRLMASLKSATFTTQQYLESVIQHYERNYPSLDLSRFNLAQSERVLRKYAVAREVEAGVWGMLW